MLELEQKAEAETAANALAARLGPGWQPDACRFIDYSRWIPKATSACGLIEVMPYHNEWWASLYTSNADTADMEFEAYGLSPEEALAKLRQVAQQRARDLVALLTRAGIEVGVEDK